MSSSEQYKMIFYQESLVKEIKKDKLQRLAERLKEADEKLLMSECQQDNDTLTKAAVVTEGESLQELIDRATPVKPIKDAESKIRYMQT